LKGSALVWSAAEFHPIAEMFARVDAYDVLGDYAKALGQRDPEDETWRYYQLVARRKGDPVRLSFTERETLCEMEEEAASRGDFHTVNRIRRFIKGAGPKSAPRRGSRRGSIASLMMFDDDDDDEEIDSMAQMLAASLEEIPPDMVKSMIEKLGRRQVVSVLVDRLRTTPLGSIPGPLLRRFVQNLVDDLIATDGRPIHE
jgi:hypothetical protein